MTFYERYKAIQKIGVSVSLPYHVWRLFGDSERTITMYGSDVCLGEDIATLTEAQTAVAWYVEQLGGTVKWKKD